jgi:hypothetical protein
MKKQDFKKLLKPLIKECIKEVMVEDDTLTNIMVGVIREMKIAPLRPNTLRKSSRHDDSFILEQKQERLEADRQRRIKLLNKKTNFTIGGVNIFEGVEALTEEQAHGRSAGAAPGALSDVSPHDEGVNISGLVNLAGGKWDQFQKPSRG